MCLLFAVENVLYVIKLTCPTSTHQATFVRRRQRGNVVTQRFLLTSKVEKNKELKPLSISHFVRQVILQWKSSPIKEELTSEKAQ